MHLEKQISQYSTEEINHMLDKSMQKKNTLRNEEGFTLLEIIAVIVIMSILAVVAVPKYFDLQDKARARAFGVAESEVRGRVNSYFAKRVLEGAYPNNINYTTENLGGPDMGDFQFSVDNNGGNASGVEDFVITITGMADTEMEGIEDVEGVDNTIDFKKPGWVAP